MSSPLPSPTPPATNIILRPGLSSDLPKLADLASEVFFNSPIDLQFFPRHLVYPVPHRDFFLQEFKLRLASPNHIVIIAEVCNQETISEVPPPVPKKSTPPSRSRLKNKKEAEYLGLKKENEKKDERKGNEIVGYAAWMRFGPFPTDSSRDIWPDDSPSKSLSRLLLHASSILSFLTSHPHSVRTMRSFHLQAASIIDSLGLESWLDLSALAVKANWQGKGVGGRLVNWGLAEADRKMVACVLEATGDGMELYERLGFRAVGEVTLKGKEVVVKKGSWLGKRKRETVTVNVNEVRMPVMVREARNRGNVQVQAL